MPAIPRSLPDLLSSHRDHVLLRTISGSQAYGLALPTSDTDERGIFALPLAAYASLQEPAEHLQDERGDVAYSSVRKLLALASAANPTALELLFAPSDCVLQCEPPAATLLAARSLFVTRRCVDSHVGYARAQIQRARGQNKWINHPQPDAPPAREAFCYVVSAPWPGAPAAPTMPLRPEPLAAAGIDLREYHCAALEHVPRTYRLYHYGTEAKGVFRNGQLVCESIPKEHEWSHLSGLLVYDDDGWQQAQRDHAHYWQWRKHRNEARWRTQETGEIDYDAKNLMHTFRLLGSAEAILREGAPRVRCNGAERDFLLRVRAGTFAYDELVARADAKIAELVAITPASDLPAAPDVAAVDELLLTVTAAWQNGLTVAHPHGKPSAEPVHEDTGLTAAALAEIALERREAIFAALTDIERKSGIRIVHACESGSRAWGFASPDSDYDVRFLYVRPRNWYLRVHQGKDSMARMLPGDLDLSGWDLRKAMGLFDSSNAALFEHLGSAIVYREDGELLASLRTLVAEFCNPIAIGNHYLGLARRMRETYLVSERVNVKKLFYVLRPIAALEWLQARSTMPPTRFDDVLAGIALTTEQRGWIASLQEQKAVLREVDGVALDPRIRAWIEERIGHFSSTVKKLPHRHGPTELLDQLLVRTVP